MALRHFLTRPGGLRAARLIRRHPKGRSVSGSKSKSSSNSCSNSSNSKSLARPRAFRKVAHKVWFKPPWGLQNRSKIGPKINPNFDVILVSFWAPLGSLLGSLLDPLGRPNRSKFGPRCPKIVPRCPKKASRPVKMPIFI